MLGFLYTNKKFREYSPLSTSRGKKLEYIGITLDYMTKGKITLLMYEYIEKMLAELLSDMMGCTTYHLQDICLTSTLMQQNC